MNVRNLINGIEDERGPVSIWVWHRCRHTALHWFTSREVADMERPRQTAKDCKECRELPKSDADRAKVADMARTRRERRTA